MKAQAIKLSEARSKIELSVNGLYKRIDEAINSKTRKIKVETLVNKAKELLSTAIDKNDEELEYWLKEASETHDNYVAKARQYIELSDETIGESTFRRKTSSCGSKTVSISSSQRRREQEIARLQREEIERENENIIKLAQQKHQLELDTISEENRKRLFDAKVKEIRAMESSNESLDGDLGEQTILNNDKNSERVTEWVDSSVANSILSSTLRSNRAENEI